MGKNGTERIVPLSESVSKACEEYRALRRTRIGNKRVCELFFVKNNNTHCSQGAAYKAFRDILRIAGIPHGGKGTGPRLHDLRHTFACHSLTQMIKMGIDLYQAMPLLSTYLGHRTIESTEKYVRLTAEMHPGLLKDVEDICKFVFPRIKTTDFETDYRFHPLMDDHLYRLSATHQNKGYNQPTHPRYYIGSDMNK